MVFIPAGTLDRRIVLEAATTVQDSYGTEIPTWAQVAELWAGKRDMQATEVFRAGGTLSEATVAFRIRWREGVTTEHRIVYKGTPYDILAVQEVAGTRNEALDLIARARPLP